MQDVNYTYTLNLFRKARSEKKREKATLEVLHS